MPRTSPAGARFDARVSEGDRAVRRSSEPGVVAGCVRRRGDELPYDRQLLGSEHRHEVKHDDQAPRRGQEAPQRWTDCLKIALEASFEHPVDAHLRIKLPGVKS